MMIIRRCGKQNKKKRLLLIYTLAFNIIKIKKNNNSRYYESRFPVRQAGYCCSRCLAIDKSTRSSPPRSSGDSTRSRWSLSATRAARVPRQPRFRETCTSLCPQFYLLPVKKIKRLLSVKIIKHYKVKKNAHFYYLSC